METNHKDLLDQVMKEESEIPMDGSMEEKMNDGCIPIHSCTGAVYFIDPKDPGNAELFAPDNMLTNISKFSEMEMSLINVMHNLLRINEFPLEEKNNYLDSLIEQFTNSLNGYGIIPKYEELNDSLTSYTKAMFMAFDLFSFAKTLNHFLVTMSMASMMNFIPGADQPTGFTNTGVFDDGEVDLPTGNERKGYKVYGHIQEDHSVTIIHIIEDDVDPSELLIVHDEDGDELDNVISVNTVATSEENAVKDAHTVFAGYIRDMYETEAEKKLRIADEMNASSGLIS